MRKFPAMGKEPNGSLQWEPWSLHSGFLSGAGTVPAWPQRGDARLQVREPTGSTLAKQAVCENESSNINCIWKQCFLGEEPFLSPHSHWVG